MICELCHKREATVHLTQEMPGGKKTRVDVCDLCFPAHPAPDSVQRQEILRLLKTKPPDGPHNPA